jgi:hypothetical protein
MTNDRDEATRPQLGRDEGLAGVRLELDHPGAWRPVGPWVSGCRTAPILPSLASRPGRSRPG